ncbi:MAG: ATP-binding protein [Promethearchaeota archaeon]
MKITRITFTNFMGYKTLNLPENQQDDFPNGLILVSGKNSYGKSTILEGILFAFFGSKVFPGRSQDSFITYGEKKSEIYIYFTVNKLKYYIYRKWTRSGTSATKFFEFNKKSGKFIEQKKINIEKFLEITKDQALSTVFVRQGEVEELANIKGAKLRDMIIDLFRLDIIDDSLKFLDQELKSLQSEKSSLESSKVPIDRIEEDIDLLKKQIEEGHNLIQEKEGLKTSYEEKLNSFPSKELILELENLYNQKVFKENKFDSFKNDFELKIKKFSLSIKDFESLDKINANIELLNKNKKELENQIKQLDNKRKATISGRGVTKGRINDFKEKISIMNTSFEQLEKGETKVKVKCPTCQTELTKEHYIKIIKEFNQEIEKNEKKIDSINKIINNLEIKFKETQFQLDNLKTELLETNNLKEDFNNYQKYKTEKLEVQRKIDQFLSENKKTFEDINPEGIKMVSIEIIKLNENLGAIKNEIQEYQKQTTINKQRITKLNKEKTKMKEIQKQINQLEIDIDHVNKSKELVRRFVTEYMVSKRLVKNIALKAEKYIKNFTAGQYSELLLEEIGSKKTGLSLKVKDHFNGQYETIEILSGGDRTALGMALRLSISELMSVIRPTKDAVKKNPKVDFLLLDEPLAALDDIRRERILRYLTKSKIFSQIFLITHTAIPSDIHIHKILVEKNPSTGISYAIFEKWIPTLE